MFRGNRLRSDAEISLAKRKLRLRSGELRLRSRKFRSRIGKFRLRNGNSFRSGASKSLKSLGRNIGDAAVRFFDFKALRGIRLRAVFALRATSPGASFGE